MAPCDIKDSTFRETFTKRSYSIIQQNAFEFFLKLGRNALKKLSLKSMGIMKPKSGCPAFNPLKLHK